MLEFLIISVAIFVGFFVQSIAGFASMLMAMPFLLMVLDLKEALALGAVFFALFSLILIPKNWRHIDKKIFGEVGLAIVFGFIIGFQVLKYGNPLILKKVLGVFILSYVVYSALKKGRIKYFEKKGVLFGLVGGFFTGLFSSGGPFIVTYIRNKLDKSAVVRGTVIGVFGIINCVRIPMLIQSKILTWDVFFKALLGIPAFLLALYLGHLFYNRLNEKAFQNIILGLLFISGVLILIK